jgi:hypothetical protein
MAAPWASPSGYSRHRTAPEPTAVAGRRDVFVSVLVRRLRPGKTYDDFVQAWYPDKGFEIPGRGPLLARNITDDREILAFDFIDLPSRDLVQEALVRVAEQEAVRHDRIAEVIESTSVRGIYEVTAEYDFSTDETVAKSRPRS